MAAGARRLALTHHDPLRDDAGVDRVLEICRRRAAGSGLDVFAAAEGLEIRFAAKPAAASSAAAPDSAAPMAARAPEPAAIAGRPTILVADDDAEIVRLIVSVLEGEGYRVVSARDGESALRLARLERPALVLLDWEMPGADGMDVTRGLRQSADPALRDVAVVLITGRSGAENTAEGFAAGVTDYLTKPFRPAHLKARVQAWLQRRPGGDP
jgi:CheY-like chemotaxis protein